MNSHSGLRTVNVGRDLKRVAAVTEVVGSKQAPSRHYMVDGAARVGQAPRVVTIITTLGIVAMT